MPKERMASILQAGGIGVSIGQYALRLTTSSDISFECYGGDLGDPWIEVECTCVEQLIADVKRISAALKAAEVPHYFDIYSEEDDDIFSISYNDRRLREKDGQVSTDGS